MSMFSQDINYDVCQSEAKDMWWNMKKKVAFSITRQPETILHN